MQLYKFTNGVFFWEDKFTKQQYLCKNLKDVILQGRFLGVPDRELETALVDMQELDHNVAEFGSINRYYLFTKQISN